MATRWWPGAVLLLTIAGGTDGADLFSLSANTTSGPSQTVTASGSDLSNLVTNLIKNQDQFAAFQNRDLSASLRYAGIPNAISIQKNAAGTSATVQIPSIGLNKTFTAADPNALKNQIIDYVKRNGAAEYGQFLRVVNEHSLAGVTDGNPLAATALLANHQYFTFGLEPAPYSLEDPPARGDAVSAPRIRFDVQGGIANTDEGNGYFASGAFDIGVRFTDRINLVFSTPFTYRRLEGANIYLIGEEAALPIAILPTRGDRSLSWTLTPAGMLGAAGSVELAAGGTFAGGGITSSLAYQIEGFTFTLADHYSYFHGYPIRIGQYRFDTDLQQQVLKNGIRVAKAFGNAFFIDGGITYTNFLERAAVDHYWTPTAGIGLRFGPAAGLRVGYRGDFAKGFTSHGGEVQLYFNF